MSDQFWANVRYILVSIGTVLVVKYLGGIIGEEHAAALVGPAVDLILGLFIGGGAVAWGNFVKSGTKAVPLATAERTDVPTVSAVTGAVTPATTSRKW
jgi:hypothetical protein